MFAVTPMLSHSSHQHSPIAPDHGRPARSITALPFAIVARAPVRPSPTHCSYFGCHTRSCGHHMTVTQPRVMQAASLAIHLVGRHGLWGFQPPFHAILVSYTLLMSLYGPRTGGPVSSLIPGSEASCMHSCLLPLVPSPISFMRTAALVTETLFSMLRSYTHPRDPAF